MSKKFVSDLLMQGDWRKNFVLTDVDEGNLTLNEALEYFPTQCLSYVSNELGERSVIKYMHQADDMTEDLSKDDGIFAKGLIKFIGKDIAWSSLVVQFDYSKMQDCLKEINKKISSYIEPKGLKFLGNSQHVLNVDHQVFKVVLGNTEQLYIINVDVRVKTIMDVYQKLDPRVTQKLNIDFKVISMKDFLQEFVVGDGYSKYR